MSEQLIHAKTRAGFDSALASNNVNEDAIAFIEDTDLIWAKNKFYSAIPKGGSEGLILSWKSDGQAKWTDFTLTELLSYGVEWDTEVADPHLTRIGNPLLHKQLPIQSQLKGCIAQGSDIIYWLDPNDWRFKKDSREVIEITAEYNEIASADLDILDKIHPGLYLIYTRRQDYVAKVKALNVLNNKVEIIFEDPNGIDVTQRTSNISGEVIPYIIGSNLSGYDGTVRVFAPEFYIKSEIEGTKRRVRISLQLIDSTWTKSEEVLVDAFRSTVLNTVPTDMGYLSTLPVNSAVSIVNTNTYCRGGKNRSTYDSYLANEEGLQNGFFRSDLGKPRTNMNRATMRLCARNAGSEMMSYNQYKNIFYWLYVIEYANFNCQEAWNDSLTSEGYKQGGLGAGVTNIEECIFTILNGQSPVTPTCVGNDLGNNSGVIPFYFGDEFEKECVATTITSYSKVVNAATISNDGANIRITNVVNPNTSILYISPYYCTGHYVYGIEGLHEGLTLTFTSGTYTTTVEGNSDGSLIQFEVNWPESILNVYRYIKAGFSGDVNIVMSIIESSTPIVSYSIPTINVPRWRGFTNPFGDIWTNLDGIIIDPDAANHVNNMDYVYTCNDPSKFSDTITEDYAKTAESIHTNGYVKAFDLGETANITASAVGEGSTTYMCDYHWTGDKNTTLRAVRVGGYAYSGAVAGLGYLASLDGVSLSNANVGFRSVSVLVS